jgi:hypothetical protein
MISFDIAAGVELVYALEFDDENMTSLQHIAAKVDHLHMDSSNLGKHSTLRNGSMPNVISCYILQVPSFMPIGIDKLSVRLSWGEKNQPHSASFGCRAIQEKRGNALREADFDSNFLLWVRGRLTSRRTTSLFEAGESVLVPILPAISKK